MIGNIIHVYWTLDIVLVLFIFIIIFELSSYCYLIFVYLTITKRKIKPFKMSINTLQSINHINEYLI